MRVTILGIRRCRIRNLGERLIRPEAPRDRPTPVRFNARLLQAKRLENGDREIKALLASLEPTEVWRFETPNAFRDCMADYNPLGRFGAATVR